MCGYAVTVIVDCGYEKLIDTELSLELSSYFMYLDMLSFRNNT